MQCHTGGDPADATRPCRTMVAKVDCSICHAEVVDQYRESTHGQLAAQGSPDAPACGDCHSAHGTLGKNDSNSPTFSRNVPALCAKCHRTGQKAAVRYKGTQQQIVENYLESIHGKGLLQGGLTVTANCADCHTRPRRAAGRRPALQRQPRPTSPAPARSATAASTSCSPRASTRRPSPARRRSCRCAATATPRTASSARTSPTSASTSWTSAAAATRRSPRRYFDTFHGKVSKLGYLKTAKCYDCHGVARHSAGDRSAVAPLAGPTSSRPAASATRGSHRQFAGYLTHATHHDPEALSVPVLHVLGHDDAAGRHARAGGDAHGAVAAALAEGAPDGPPRSRRAGRRLRPPLHGLPAQPPPHGDRRASSDWR